mmetsp:Transcript_85052/g.164900  ORF Transcript_85052/g.164900 Transcript_85052/m.164900 type:complete len:286 (-) Transcript_85052:63-920(-)
MLLCRTRQPSLFRYIPNSASYHVSYDKRLPDENAPFERVTPVFFLRGPWHSSWAWHSTMDRLAAKGFESWAVRSDALSDLPMGTVDDEIASLVKSLPPFSSPPVLVGHGLGAFVALKYLESYAATGLVLVAPFSPNPDAAALGRLASDQLFPTHSAGDSSLKDRANSEPDPSALRAHAGLPSSALNLEPLDSFLEGVLIVTTETDPVVTCDDLSTLMSYSEGNTGIQEYSEPTGKEAGGVVASEGLFSTHLSVPGSGGHLSMADPDWEKPGGLSEQLAEWVAMRF